MSAGREPSHAALSRVSVIFASVLLCVSAVSLAPGIASAETIEVTVTEDDNKIDDQQCTLREAIDAANTNLAINPANGKDCAGGESGNTDTIALSTPGFYFISLGSSGDDANAGGDFDVLTSGGDVVIEGFDFENTIIDGQDLDRVFDIHDGGSAQLADLTVTNGTTTDGTGGGIRSDAKWKLSDATVTQNNVTGAALTSLNGGGIANGSQSFSISDSSITQNTINASTANTNASIGGGGIAFAGAGGSIDRTTISNNTVTGAAAGNQAAGGGGVGMDGATADLSIANSAIRSNSVSTGSQPFAPAGGGGVYWSDTGTGPELSVENTTLDANTASAGSNFSLGGGLFVESGAVAKVANATFAANSGGSFGGDAIGSNGSAQVRGSILTGSDECSGMGSITSMGHNIEGGSDSCSFSQTGDLVSATINLGPMGNNGGPTSTRAPGPGSVAIDHIPPGSCLGTGGAPLARDQRGAPRPSDSGIALACESGAVEVVLCQGAVVNHVGTAAGETIVGTSSDDAIIGLGGNDRIEPRSGNDKVCAGEGADTLEEANADGTDSLDGEGGSDTLEFADNVNGGTIDLANSTASGSGTSGVAFSSIENAAGSPDPDTLIGSAGPNRLEGDVGPCPGFCINDVDTIIGNGGSDQLLGGIGNDNLFARDGEADVVDCGSNISGNDTAQTDQPSLDSVTGCEIVDALAEPVIPATPAATPPATATATAPAAVPTKCKKGFKLKKGKCKKKRKK